MAINVTQLKADIKTKIEDNMSAYTNNIYHNLSGDVPPDTTPSDFSAFAEALADAMIIVAQHIKDNADLVGVTAGSDTVLNGLE